MKQLFGDRRHRIILPLTVMIMAGLVGTYVLTRSHAQVTTSTTPPACAQANTTNPFPTLSPGSTDRCVKFLQWTLDNLQFTDSKNGTLRKSYDVPLTGTFDGQTELAVQDIQKKLYAMGCTIRIDGFVTGGTLPTDGTVDPMTWYMLTNMSNQPGFHGGGYTCGQGNPLT